MDKEEAEKFCMENCADIPKFMREFMHVWARLCSGTAINHHQVGLLFFINEKQRCKMSDLAAELALTPAAITQIVDPLVDQGYLERTRDKNDRRVVLVTLTEKAHEVLRLIKGRRTILMRELFSSLTQDEASTLVSLIQRLKNSLESLDINAVLDDPKAYETHNWRSEFANKTIIKK
ncbi:MAG: MarR family transcriptional regulator [Actinomycetota bacterium]